MADTAVGRELYEAVVKDRYDKADYAETLTHLGGLGVARDRLADITDLAEDVMADAHAMFLRATTRMRDDIPPAYSLPAAVMAELPNTEQFGQLKEHTTGDPILSGMAVTALSASLGDLFDRLKDVQEQADRAQAAHDELQAAWDRLQDEPPDAGTEDLLEELQAAYDREKDLLDAQLDEAAPRIGRAARAAAREAGEKIDGAAAAVAAWGQEAGEFARTDPDERIRLMEIMQTPELRAIADLFGRLRWEMNAEIDQSYINGPTEIHSVKLGNDLNQIVPSEFALLAVPELRIEFYRKFAGRQLVCYRNIEREKLARGPVVYVMDASLSMRGQRIRWAVSFGLALLSIARGQGRAFHAISFHGPNTFEEFPFPKPAEFELDKMLAFARVAPSGGTDFMGPLSRAAQLCTADYEATNLQGADIVFVTDGEADVTDEWLATFRDQRDTAGFRTWAVAVEQDVPAVLPAICDLAAPIGDLFSGGDVKDIFKRVAQNYEPVRSR